MKRFLQMCAVGLWIGSLGGCAAPGVLSELPDPVFQTVRPARRQPVPAPAMVVLPPPETPAPYAGVGWVPPGGVSRRWTCIVIHHSASEVGGARAFDRFHREQRGWDELGYHFVVGNGSDSRDGEIEVGPRWTKQKHGAHCKTPDNFYNDHGIGICLVGDFTHHPPTRAQMRALARLIGFLMETCGIPASRILAHGQVAHPTECPGARFSVAEVKTLIDSRVSAVSHVR